MADRWLPLLLSSDPPALFDDRTSPSAWRGIVIWLTNNFEPIKLMVATLPLLAALVYVGALYVKAEAATEKIAAVASLAERMKQRQALPAGADRLLEAIQHGLNAGLQRTPVLWVDDNPDWNHSERIDLTRFGLCFALAKSTEEALNFLHTNPGKFSGVISDFSRPADPKDGYGLLDEMKAQKLHIPFIFYAWEFTDKQASEAVERGAQAEVRDPIELLSEVLRALPQESKEPGRTELIAQKLVGCRWMWHEPR
jgi:CheY-like chemotaxis protein